MLENVKSWSATILPSVGVLNSAAAFLLLAVLFTANAPPASAQSTQLDPNARVLPQYGEPLGAEEQAILLQEIETYFNGVGTLYARFLQYNMDGSTYRGDVMIKRPGLMRIDYDPPVPYLIIVDGSFYIFIDEELEEAAHIPLSLTPAAMLLRQPMKLEEDLNVLEAARDDGFLYITVSQKEAEDAGTLTFAFEEEPLALRQWTVIDSQGIVTRVLLQDPVTDVSFDEALFQFVNPWNTREGGN